MDQKMNGHKCNDFLVPESNSVIYYNNDIKI